MATNINTKPAIFPNPNHGSFQLNLPATINAQKTIVQLTDVYGKVVLSKNCNVVNGYVCETIHAENLAAGMYFLRTSDTEKSNSIKIIIN